MSFLFSTVFATTLQKLTAENAARQCKFSARVKGFALAAVQRQSAGRAKARNTQCVPYRAIA